MNLRYGKKMVVAAGAVAVLLGGALSACGGDEKSAAAESDGSPPTFTIIAQGGPAAGSLEFEMAPTSPAGVVTVDFQNKDSLPQQAMLLKLKDGVSVAEFSETLATAESSEALLPLSTYAGGPHAVEGGASGTVTLSLDPASTYMVVSGMTAGDGGPAFLAGLLGSFTTESQANGAAMPPAEATVSMQDFRFANPDQIDWTKPILVSNDGDQPHEMMVLGPLEGETIAQLRARMEGEAMEPPGHFHGGLATFGPGLAQMTTLDLPPGSYLLQCYVMDPVSGMPHAMIGMDQEITVG